MFQIISKKKIKSTNVSNYYEGFIYVSDDKMPTNYDDFADYLTKSLNFGYQVDFYPVDKKNHIYKFVCEIYCY